MLMKLTTETAFESGRRRGPVHRAPHHLLGIVCRAAGAVLVWRDRAHERSQLAAMDARQRKDIGLTRVDLWCEVKKPFWLG